MNNFAIKVLTSGLLLSGIVGNLPVFASEKTNSNIVSTFSMTKVSLNDEDALKKIINENFDENLKNLSLVSDDEDKKVFETEDYVVTASGLDLNSVGHQTVNLTLERKASENVLPFELPAAANLPKTEVEPTTKQIHLKVEDTTAPEIVGEDTYTTDQNVKLDLVNSLSATDDNDGEVEVSISGDVDYGTIGSYTLVASATDKSGNTSTKNITVNVEENFYDKIASAALAQVGVNQDCTMLVTNSLKAVGINFHGSPSAYLSLGEVTNNPVPGDIIVYSGHVAIYIGNGQAVHGGWNGYQTVVTSVECSNAFIAYVHVNK